jgi:hypothetical protein
LDVWGGLIYFIKERDEEGSCFSGAIFGSGNDAFTTDDEGNGLLLNGCGYEVAGFGECEYEIFLYFELCEIFELGGLDILD